LKQSEIYEIIQSRVVQEENWRNSTCWYELYHVVGRLLAYKETVYVLFRARILWPELFDEFEVEYVPSSKRIPNPLKTDPSTAVETIRRMISDPIVLEIYKSQVQELQRFELDQMFNKKWKNSSFLPAVHAEVLLFNWLANTASGTRPARFFKGNKFIGSSKPTCKLCSYFFDSCGTDVRVRPSHWNLYLHWRMPDIYTLQGEAAVNTRRDTMQKIKKRICVDIARTLSERLADGRPHDSSTNSLSILPALRLLQLPDDGTVLGGRTDKLKHPSPSVAGENVSALAGNQRGRLSSDEQSVVAANSEDEDGDGVGILIFQGRRGG
jgi:OTT_1508-like deaminase